MRRRIVINVDNSPSEVARRQSSGKRRRWPKVLAILALLILLAVVGVVGAGYFWWRNYQSTPEYALVSLVHAAQKKDMPELQKLINDDELAKHLATNVSQKAAARYGLALNSSIQQRIDALMPTLLPQMKQTIRNEALEELSMLASSIEPQGFIPLMILLPKFTDVKTEGNTAHVKANILDRATEFSMQKNGEQWQLVDFKDDMVVQLIVDSVMKELPAIGNIDANNPLLKQPRNRPRRRR